MKPEVTSTHLEEAASWSAKLRADATAVGDFELWLKSHPSNEAAWAWMKRTEAKFDELAPSSPELVARLHAARRGAPSPRAKAPVRRPAIAYAAGIAAITVIGGGAWSTFQPAVYQTGPGEHRTIALKDGSRLALDAATRITVRYTPIARKLDLIRGQARFDVAHDAARPFSVHAGHQTVVATGTRFDVDVLGPRVVVTLLQGHVIVVDDKPMHPTKSPSPAKLNDVTPPIIHLEVGHRLIATNDLINAVPTVQAIDPRTASEWETGQIIFDGETLDAAAARINRYTDKPVVVSSKEVAKLRVTGAFKAGDSATFIEEMTLVFPLRAVQDSHGVVTLEPTRHTSG